MRSALLTNIFIFLLLVVASYTNINIAIQIGDETKVNRPATDLTILNVGLACFGLINQHVEIFTAVRAFNVFFEQLQLLHNSFTSDANEPLFLPQTSFPRARVQHSRLYR